MANQKRKTMKFLVLGFRLVFLLLTAAFLTKEYSLAQTADQVKIPAALICGPFTGNPPRTPAFADKFIFDFSNGNLTSVRPTRVQKGSETYKGSVDSAGKIQISGVGNFENHSSEWTSEYTGQLQEKAPTVLQGTMRIKDKAVRVHKCTIGFLMAPADLTKALLPGGATAQQRPQ
jgi:hypothetical protein